MTRAFSRGLGVTILAAGSLLVLGLGLILRTFEYVPMSQVLYEPGRPASAGPQDVSPGGGKLESEWNRLEPKEPYIVIDAENNRLSLREGNRILLEAVCSTGSDLRLREGSSGREWLFRTPRGVFRVTAKTENPMWRKPDWAFLEERLPLPEDPGDRFEADVLGDYALYLGNGYLIHGTLYERLLGRSVTHGCIRLGSKDLERVYHATRLGTTVYIY